MTTFYEHCYDNRIEVTIPEGFNFKEGDVESGLVIENGNGDTFVRIPAGYTADGIYIGGFWVSAYYISKGSNGQARSIPEDYPWTEISFYEAEKVVKNFGGDLLSQEEYNRICMWLVQTHATSFEKVFIDGVGMGNYSNSFEVQRNGTNPEWIVNNIDCFWGNVYTWTTQRSELYEHYRKIRGGTRPIFGTDICPPPSSSAWAEPEKGSPVISFRLVLHDAVKTEED